MNKTYTWSYKGHLGYAIEESTPKGRGKIVDYVKTQEDAIIKVARMNSRGESNEQE